MTKKCCHAEKTKIVLKEALSIANNPRKLTAADGSLWNVILSGKIK